MPPALPLRRQPFSVNVRHPDAVRSWLLDQVRLQVLDRAQPLPRIWLFADGHLEYLDLDRMAKADPGASPGATFRLLAQRRDIERRFLVCRFLGVDEEDAEHAAALVIEEFEDDDGRIRYWGATLPYEVDASFGTGRLLAPDWEKHEAPGVDALPEFARPLVLGAPDDRPANVVPPQFRQPDVRVMFLDVPPKAQPPRTAEEMAGALEMMALAHVLKEGIGGTLVVRIAGREIQWWELREDDWGAFTQDQVIQQICWQDPRADSCGILQLARFPGPEGGVGVQMIGELGGRRVERWAMLGMPEGPGGPKVVTGYKQRTYERFDEPWLGVDPDLPWQFGPLPGSPEA